MIIGGRIIVFKDNNGNANLKGYDDKTEQMQIDWLSRPIIRFHCFPKRKKNQRRFVSTFLIKHLSYSHIYQNQH